MLLGPLWGRLQLRATPRAIATGCLLSGWKKGSWKVAFAEGAGAGVDVNFGVQQANKGVMAFSSVALWRGSQVKVVRDKLARVIGTSKQWTQWHACAFAELELDFPFPAKPFYLLTLPFYITFTP